MVCRAVDNLVDGAAAAVAADAVEALQLRERDELVALGPKRKVDVGGSGMAPAPAPLEPAGIFSNERERERERE